RPFEAAAEGRAGLEEIREISPEFRDEILTLLPYWEADGHLDLDIVEGLRNYRSEENRRYTGWEGLGIYFDGRYARNQLGITALVAGGFMAGEHLMNPPFMWQTYTTNFLSSIGGSLEHHTEWNESLRFSESLSSISGISPSQRRLANIEAADARARMARDHLYWAFMTPIVIGACLADVNFRRFLRSPGILPRYFIAQMGTG